MSKRSAFPQYGDRKKAKLDISRSDHHLPLSQNTSTNNKENNCDVWGDDDDEQMLLQASQACEEEQINDISMLPDYSIWKQPGSTSTQYQSPSTSKASFEFKKPSSVLPSSISTHLKNKCHTISSPLPGISTMSRDRHLTDDLAISDKIVSGPESDICRRLLILEEENNKLKSEYGKLSDKIVTKEGEASILRSQLRASQIANDNARMEKIRAQEKVQMECNEKLAAVTKEMQSLKSQLEFKDLEILSVKDKFKKLEANKLRLTQVNENSSHRHNSTLTAPYDAMTQPKRAKMTSNSVQTDHKAPFLKLNKSYRKGLHNSLSVPSHCKMSSMTFNCTRNQKQETQQDEQLQLFSSVRQELSKLESELAAPGCQEAGERARPGPSELTVSLVQLLEPRALYSAERGGPARRRAAELAAALHSLPAAQRFYDAETQTTKEHGPTILDTAIRICNLIENTSCCYLFSGFLMALILTFDSLLRAADALKPKIFTMTKAILLSKPMPFVTLGLLAFVKRILSINHFLPSFCPRSGGNGIDVDQEMINPEACYLVMLLKQSEDSLSCIKDQGCGHSVLVALRSLLDIFAYVNDKYRGDNSRCECQVLLPRVLVHCLREAVEILVHARYNTNSMGKWYQPLVAACRSCVQQVHKCVMSDGEWVARLLRHEGLLSDAVHRLHTCDTSLSELTELKNTFQTAPEDTPSSYLQKPFMASFESFSMTD